MSSHPLARWERRESAINPLFLICLRCHSLSAQPRPAMFTKTKSQSFVESVFQLPERPKIPESLLVATDWSKATIWMDSLSLATSGLLTDGHGWIRTLYCPHQIHFPQGGLIHLNHNQVATLWLLSPQLQYWLCLTLGVFLNSRWRCHASLLNTL